MTTVTLYKANSASKAKAVIERIKTFEDACRELGLSTVQIGVDGLSDDEKSIHAYAKLIIIARALNEGWTPDWNNTNQYKYVPWFKENSGFGLSYNDFVGWISTTNGGSRLCYKTRELAEYAAKQFADIYKDFLTIQ